MKKENYPKDWPCKYCYKTLAEHTSWRNCITNGMLAGSFLWTPIDNLQYLEKCYNNKVDKNGNSRKV